MLHRYVHGAEKGVDDPLIWWTAAAYGWRQALIADQQGSIIAIADRYGTPAAINSYDEYGIPGANNQGRFQYAGQAWIRELGMYYYKARFYSPTLGRFLQTDPIGYKDQINLYAYVENDPVNREDPTGLGDIYPQMKPDSNAFGDMWNFLTEDVARAYRDPSLKNVSWAVLGITPAGRTLTKAYGAIRVFQASAAFGRTGARALLSAAKPAMQGLREGGGRVIASGSASVGSKDYFRHASDFAKRFGGSAADYQKVATGTIATTANGAKIEVHAVRNLETGKIYDLKYKLQGGRD